MSKTLDEAITKLTDATTAAGAEVALLRGELANVATPEQLARLDALSDKLTGLATDVPPTPAPAT